MTAGYKGADAQLGEVRIDRNGDGHEGRAWRAACAAACSAAQD